MGKAFGSQSPAWLPETSPYVRYWDESKTKREACRDKQTETKKTEKMSECSPLTKTTSESMKDTGTKDKKDRRKCGPSAHLFKTHNIKHYRANSPKKQPKGAWQQRHREKSRSGQTASTVLVATGKKQAPRKGVFASSPEKKLGPRCCLCPGLPAAWPYVFLEVGGEVPFPGPNIY